MFLGLFARGYVFDTLAALERVLAFGRAIEKLKEIE